MSTCILTKKFIIVTLIMKLKQILTCGLLPFFVITTKFIELVVSSTVPKAIKIKHLLQYILIIFNKCLVFLS